jgi:hypothetical protein
MFGDEGRKTSLADLARTATGVALRAALSAAPEPRFGGFPSSGFDR